MIFKPELAQMVMSGRKTVTRRLVKPGDQYIEDHAHTDSVIEASGRVRWEVWKTYAVCPGRGKNGIGRIVITDIRRERLQDISTDDCVFEGIEWRGVYRNEVHDAFRALWESINKTPGTRWEDNPDVWRIAFEVVTP